jgi:hypothetical protein
MTDIRERLTAALDNYEEKRKESRQDVIAPSQDDRDLLLDTLTLLASYDSGQPTRAFRTPSRETTQAELSDIAKRASDLPTRLRDPKRSMTRAREQLAQRLEDMHETTICALANAPAVIIHGEPALLNVGFLRCGLPGLLRDDSTDRERLANELDPLALAAAVAEAPNTTDEGRWPDRRVQAVAGLLERFYHDAKELEPTFATRNVKRTGEANAGEHYGPWLDLVSSVFEAMNINRKAYSFAYRAADKIREKGEEKSTP